MNSRMKEDYIKLLEKKNRQKLIAIFILSILLAVCLVLLLTQFEVVVEDSTEVSYDVEQDSGDGGSNEATLDMSQDETDVTNPINTICGAALGCTLIIVGGKIVYGKTKNKSQDKEDAKDNDPKEKREEKVNE